jgi:hypothetical protein
MTPTDNSYRIFPPGVISNTFDFDVRRVNHNGRRMYGVFSRRQIRDSECAVFIGVYPGKRRSEMEQDEKAARYAERHGVELDAAKRRMAAYVLSLKRPDPGYVLDPTDPEGELASEFEAGIVLYINENPPGAVPKASFVWNAPRNRYEVWLRLAAAQDEEIYLYYGSQYFRDYPVDAELGKDEHYYNIPAESVFIEDSRGIPAPLQSPPGGEL